MANLKENGPTEDKDGARGAYERVIEGDILITDDERVSEQDVISMYLPGMVPGGTSRDKGEDPNFRPIYMATPPTGRRLTDEDAKIIQDYSCQRFLMDTQYGGIIEAFTVFIIGRGFKITALDENPDVQAYVDEFLKVNRFDGRDRCIVETGLKAGEIFIRLFVTADGKPARIPVIRFLHYYEIVKVVCDPKDPETVLAYHRGYTDDKGQPAIEQIPAAEIMHIKMGDEGRGLPPLARIAGQCQYYADWLFNRIVLNRLKTSYYLEEIVDGTASAVSAMDAQATNQLRQSKTGKIIKRMPKPGSKLTHNKSVEYKWLKPEVGADDAREDGRAIRMAICAGAQVPEFILGDASQSNYASALVAQNPFVRKVELMQDFFGGHMKRLIEWVIKYGIEGKHLPSKSSETVMKEKARYVTRWRKMKKIFRPKEEYDAAGNIVTKEPTETKTDVGIQWPTLVAQNLLQDTQAYQLHQAMGVASKETLSQKLGYDYEEELARLQHEDAMEPDDEQNPEDGGGGFGGDKRDGEINQDEDPSDTGGKKPPAK